MYFTKVRATVPVLSFKDIVWSSFRLKLLILFKASSIILSVFMSGHAIMVEIICENFKEFSLPSSCENPPLMVLHPALPCTRIWLMSKARKKQK